MNQKVNDHEPSPFFFTYCPPLLKTSLEFKITKGYLELR